MVKTGPKPPGERNKVESKKLHKLGKFPKLRATGRAVEKHALLRVLACFRVSNEDLKKFWL